ncbi:MAG TPA: hypothetical protein ENK02_05220 [Planctomycetes bacterium]|nr:hypothetical protein [Planctomycetota bacterium]
MGPLPAQGSPAYSRLDFSNAYRLQREDGYPNARSAKGNEAGDFVYKVFPLEVLGRGEDIRVSGVRISFSVDDSYQGNFPVSLGVPEIAFFPVKLGKAGGLRVELPQLGRRLKRSLQPPGISVLSDGIFATELRLGPKQPDPRLRTPVVLPAKDPQGNPQGWAVALMAPRGEVLGKGKPLFVPMPSFGEIHRVPGSSTFSGFYDARKKRFLPFGTPGAPSNQGELGVELFLDGPVLQVFSDASGGVRGDPNRVETHMGPGAYRNGLGSSVLGGFVGFYTQWENQEGKGLLCLPLITTLGARRPTGTWSLGAVRLLLDPGRAGALFLLPQVGLVGGLTRYKARGVAGHSSDQKGVYVTPRIPVPASPSLAGQSLWLQSLLLRPGLGFAGSSNLVLLRF